jgi:hypothetical protein
LFAIIPGEVFAGSIPVMVNVTIPPETRKTEALTGPAPEGGHVDPRGPPMQVHV